MECVPPYCERTSRASEGQVTRHTSRVEVCLACAGEELRVERANLTTGSSTSLRREARKQRPECSMFDVHAQSSGIGPAKTLIPDVWIDWRITSRIPGALLMTLGVAVWRTCRALQLPVVRLEDRWTAGKSRRAVPAMRKAGRVYAPRQ